MCSKSNETPCARPSVQKTKSVCPARGRVQPKNPQAQKTKPQDPKPSKANPRANRDAFVCDPRTPL